MWAWVQAIFYGIAFLLLGIIVSVGLGAGMLVLLARWNEKHLTNNRYCDRRKRHG